MVINIDGVKYAIELLDNTYFDKKKYKKYIYSKGGKIFLSHESELGRNTNVSILEREINRIFEDPKYRDSYGFYILKANLKNAIDDIEYFKRNEKEILAQVLCQVYQYIPKQIKINPDIILYVGGVDGGFATFTKNVYINYLKYVGNLNEFKKILCHEFYHARQIFLYKKLELILKMSYNNRPMYELLGRICEEGIACLIQQGLNFKVDDPVGTLTNRDITLRVEHFNDLNNALYSIKNISPNYSLIYNLNVYVIGYIICKTIYEYGDCYPLDEWTCNLNYEAIINKYIDVCKEQGFQTGFEEDIENWLNDIFKIKYVL